MELTVTIDLAHIRKDVKKHLSVMGKRQKNNEGTAFTSITLSSAEEELMNMYIKAAVEVFVGEMEKLITYYNYEDFLVFEIRNTRWANDKTSITVPFEGNFIGYVVAYVGNAVLGMNYPELAKKYAEDMGNHLKAAIKLVYYKQEPKKSRKTLADMKGEVVLD